MTTEYGGFVTKRALLQKSNVDEEYTKDLKIQFQTLSACTVTTFLSRRAGL